MNSKTAKGSFIIIFISFISFVYLYLTGTKPIGIISMTALIFLLIAISIMFNGYLLPSKWIYKNRFWMNGAIFGLFLFMLNASIRIHDGKIVTQKEALIMAIASIAMGILILGTVYYRSFRKVRRNTPFHTDLDEHEIITDSATLNDEDTFKRGRLILTNKRLCFIANDEENTRIVFQNLKTNIRLLKHLGVPNQLYIPGNKTRIQVAFPCYWKQEIEKVMLN